MVVSCCQRESVTTFRKVYATSGGEPTCSAENRFDKLMGNVL